LWRILFSDGVTYAVIPAQAGILVDIRQLFKNNLLLKFYQDSRLRRNDGGGFQAA
jgi:hypothetical protein